MIVQMLMFSGNFLKGFCKGEGRSNILHAFNRVHIGWQQQIFLYINEHIYVYKRSYFILNGT